MNIAAMYLTSKIGEGKAVEAIVGAVRRANNADARGALASTVKFEPVVGSGLAPADWRKILSDVVTRVGKLENFVPSELDKTNVAEFIAKYGRQQ